jgi:hypothetical protein
LNPATTTVLNPLYSSGKRVAATPDLTVLSLQELEELAQTTATEATESFKEVEIKEQEFSDTSSAILTAQGKTSGINMSSLTQTYTLARAALFAEVVQATQIINDAVVTIGEIERLARKKYSKDFKDARESLREAREEAEEGLSNITAFRKTHRVILEKASASPSPSASSGGSSPLSPSSIPNPLRMDPFGGSSTSGTMTTIVPGTRKQSGGRRTRKAKAKTKASKKKTRKGKARK